MNLPSLSVVVPVYNEEKLIARCLDAVLAEQDVDEVVVVDNNSTDATADIVAKIASSDDRVRLIAEPTQGVVAARNAGMKAAGSDLLARIDADSVVSQGWASTIKTFLAEHPEFAAITGPIPSDDPKLYPVIRLLGSLGSKAASEVEFRDTGALLGPNMVVRRDAWNHILGDLHVDADIWEDADVSLCLTNAGLRCAFVPALQAQVSHRRHRTGWRSFRDYTAQLPRTFSVNGMRWQAAASWSSVWLQRVDYLVYRGIVRRKAADVDLAIP